MEESPEAGRLGLDHAHGHREGAVLLPEQPDLLPRCCKMHVVGERWSESLAIQFRSSCWTHVLWLFSCSGSSAASSRRCSSARVLRRVSAYRHKDGNALHLPLHVRRHKPAFWDDLVLRRRRRMRCSGGYARIKALQAAVTGTRETAKGMFSWFGFGFWHVWKGGTACCASGDIPTGGRQGHWFRKTAADLVTVVRFDHPRYVKVSLLSEGLIRVYNASSTSTTPTAFVPNLGSVPRDFELMPLIAHVSFEVHIFKVAI